MENATESQDLVSHKETRKMLGGVSRWTIGRWSDNGLLEPIYIRGRKYFRRDDILKLQQEGG